MNATDEFAAVAREYVAWAEQAPASDALRESLIARRLLARLIAAVIELPRDSNGGDAPEIPTDEWRGILKRFGALPFNYYSECYNPLVVPAEDTVTADLADDLADIWRDVKTGLVLYDAGDRGGAEWQWVFNYSAHWGHHATAALYALQTWISQEGDDRYWE